MCVIHCVTLNNKDISEEFIRRKFLMQSTACFHQKKFNCQSVSVSEPDLKPETKCVGDFKGSCSLFIYMVTYILCVPNY